MLLAYIWKVKMFNVYYMNNRGNIFKYTYLLSVSSLQKKGFSIYDQIRSFLRIWSHVL